MDFLGIGPLELGFILLIALIVLGPKDMVKAGKTIGRTLRSIVTSENWRTIQQASKEVRDLPNRLMREAGMEDLKNQLPDAEIIRREMALDDLDNEMQKAQDDLADWTTPPTDTPPQPQVPAVESQAEETTSEESPSAEASTEQQPQEPAQGEFDTSDIGSIAPPGIDK